MGKFGERLATQTSYVIKLMNPSQSGILLGQAFGRRSDPAEHLGRRMLGVLHERHIGITPRLALALGDMLRPQGRALQETAWTKVVLRLTSEQGDKCTANATQVMLRSNLTFCLQRIVLPLMAEACRRIGCTWLFTAEGPADSASENEYRDYDQKLEWHLGELTLNFAMFWKERGLSLASQSLHRFHRSMERVPLTPIADFSVMWRLTTSAQSDPQTKARHHLRLHLEHQKNERHTEGGVDGIKQTHSLSDLQNMLISERLYPLPLLADRILNSGFMAHRRPPQRERRRDTLIVGLLPGSLQGTPSTAFVKTCWCEALCRLGAYLTERGMSACEFRWIEGNPLGHWRGQSVFPKVSTHRDKDSERRKALLVLQAWLPSLLDVAAPFRAPKSSSSRYPEFDWFSSAWADQRDHLYWVGQEEDLSPEDQGGPLSPRRFAHLHLMLFIPCTEEPDEERARQLCQSLPHALALGDQPQIRFSIQFVPENGKVNGSWMTKTPDMPLQPSQLLASATYHELASLLVHRWLEQWIGELYEGA